MKRTDRRSDCPTNYALQAIGDSWSLLVVRDLMFYDKRTFSEFAASEERISTNVLAQRLRHLVAEGILVREGAGKHTRYGLTRKGLDLLPIMIDMIVWSGRHDAKTAAPEEFLRRAERDREALLRDLRQRLATAHGLTPI